MESAQESLQIAAQKPGPSQSDHLVESSPDREGRLAVSVLIVTFNRAALLDRCLASLARQSETADEVLVYVNGSTDGTASAVRENYPLVRVVHADRNYGCPGGRNRGIAASSHEWVLCVDDDGTLPADAIARARAAVLRYPDAAVIAGVYRDGRHSQPEALVPGPTFSFPGGMCLIRREKFLRYGGYHEDGLRQGEEEELSYQLFDAGEPVYLAPDLILDHPIDSRGSEYQTILRSGARQTFLTTIKITPGPVLPALLVWKLLVYAAVASRRKCLSAVVLGVWDALLLAPKAWRGRRPVRYRTLTAPRRYRQRRAIVA